MSNGWIRLHRSLLESKIWTLPASHLKVAIACLLLANWKDGEVVAGGIVKIPRGSLVTSRDELAKHAGVTPKVVRGALANLEVAEFLTRKRSKQWAKRFTYISITNYESYQGDEDEEGQGKGQPRAKEGPTEGQGRAMIEEGKKDKNLRREERSPTPTPFEALELADHFRGLIQGRQPDNLQISLEHWAKTRDAWGHVFRLMASKDGRGWGDMRRVLDWSQADAFWSSNILSATKFRQKYDTLNAQSTRQVTTKTGGLSCKDLMDRAERLRKEGR